jgi:putative DNA primase/helicase
MNNDNEGYNAIASIIDGEDAPFPEYPGDDDFAGDYNSPSAPYPLPPPPVGEGAADETLAACSVLDHSDTDNGVRLITYFPDQLLVMQAAGVAGGDRLVWSGRHWDIDNGEAGAFMLAQRVGDMIQREADVMAATDHEKRMIEAGNVAQIELDGLLAIDADKRTDENRKEIREKQDIIAMGKGAKRALASRKVAHRKFGVTSKNATKLRGMLECVSPRLRKPIVEFNASALSVATMTHTLHFHQDPDPENPDPSGTRFLSRVEAVKGHKQSDYITALVPIDYNAKATAPIFTAWIEKMMPDAEARRTLQQYCGVSILGVPLQRFMFHYGEGANGKSVFLELLMRLLGKSFAVGLPTESIIGQGDRSAGGASPDLIRLFGKRMVRVLELPEGKPLQSELIKKLTGGEEIPVRTLFKGFIDFMPRAKPHMSGNGLPKITDTSNGIWRRMLFLRWPIQIAEADMRDPEVMVEEMLGESSGILNWLCAGALDFLQHGLFIAPSVATDVRDYRKEMDIVMQFVDDCVEKKEGETVQAREMFNAFKEWCAANSKTAIFETKFGRDMKRHLKRDDSKRLRVYLDAKLREDRPRWTGPARDDPPHPAEGDEVPW